ncbi:hypothetical protein [Fluoribacter gormanii]|uniref:hypothetical protein n=1 Tax=Fluoribacter gormanii TaxID=464 RepID=UPI001F5E8507|nr:hypothetical protein [Fluoribacter gormanii]
MGITTCHSERKDKQIWHKRWRARERTLFNSTSFDELDAYLPIIEKQVSNIWTMGKDGKQYWSIQQQAIIAEISAQKKGRTLKESFSIKNRHIHKSMGK